MWMRSGATQPSNVALSDLKRSDPNDDFKQQDSYCLVDNVEFKHPSLSRSLAEFTVIKTLNKDSAHEVSIVVDKEGRTYYLKNNSGNTPVSELEAAAAGCFRV